MLTNEIKCSIIVSLTGDFFKVHKALFDTLQMYQNLPENMELIVICDGLIWGTIPFLQTLRYKKNIHFIENTTETNHLGKLFNQGIKQSIGKYVTFIWPGVIYPIDNILNHCNLLDSNTELSCLFSKITHEIEHDLSPMINYGWIQCKNIISLAGALFRTDKIIENGCFREEQSFQRYINWELFLKLSKYCDLKYDTENNVALEWDIIEYPYNSSFHISQDSIHRILEREDRADSDSKVINITVTGGYWEPTHNQLCFNNYFELEKANDLYSWKFIFDFQATEDDVLNSDLVIISRGRHPNVINIINYCEKNSIPTLYMIDDNWFTVAQDWPVYKDVFSPGLPDYEVFIESLSRCDSVLLYSDYLESYVEKYAKKIHKMNVNINLNHFQTENSKITSRKLIGYAGSPRYNDVAFEGLFEFIKHNDEWDVLLFGIDLPAQFMEMKDSSRLKLIEYKSYHKYAQMISTLKPDILIASLDNCPSSWSKCPNKFLEITAAGAVGIYPDIKPYSTVVTHMKSGLLIPETDLDDIDAWYKAINYLAQNEGTRKELHEAALSKVEESFETTRCFDTFSMIIEQSIKGRINNESSTSFT